MTSDDSTELQYVIPFYIQSAGNMPADFFVIHPEKLPMAGGIYFIYAMYGLCVRNMVV